MEISHKNHPEFDDLLIVRDYADFFHQHISSEKSLDCPEIIEALQSHGIQGTLTNYEELMADGNLWKTKNKFIWYTSSQKPGYKQYIDDIICNLDSDNYLIPSYDLFRAHDDKLYQEILIRKLGLKGPQTWAFAALSDIEKNRGSLSFPLVLKFPDGFGSSGVKLVYSWNEIEKLYSEHFSIRGSIKAQVKNRILPRKSNSQEPVFGKVVLQEMIEDLDHDWKVLIFGDRFYTLKRSTREGDFRASGSGLFQIEKAPDHVLDFAEQCHNILQTPTSSLDVAERKGECWLIEFQATHFGPYTQITSPDYYQRSSTGQ